MNVALVKLSSLGDVVHTLPVAATLKARLPGVRITWLVERREAAVLAGHPALEAVVAVDTRGWRRARSPAGLAASARELAALRRRLRAGRFHVAIDAQGLVKSGVLTALTAAPLRIGFAAARCRERASALFTTRRVLPPPDARHVVEQSLALLEPLGVREPVLDFHLPAVPEAEARIEAFFAGTGLKRGDRVVVLNPGAGRPAKRWPPAAFAALARRLADEAARVLVVWGPGEEALARAIVAEAGPSRALLAPPTDVPALLAMLRRASVVVAADTGPLHLAAALGRPCVGLYGPSRAERNGPYGAGHRTLEGADGRVEAIPVEAVAAAVGGLLG